MGLLGSLFRLGISESERFEFSDSLIEIVDHFAQSVSQSGILIDKNLLRLILEEVFNSWNVNLPASFVFLLYLCHVESQTFETAC